MWKSEVNADSHLRWIATRLPIDIIDPRRSAFVGPSLLFQISRARILPAIPVVSIDRVDPSLASSGFIPWTGGRRPTAILRREDRLVRGVQFGVGFGFAFIILLLAFIALGLASLRL
jgi:hypothetical protein